MINGKLTLNVLQMCANGCIQLVFNAVSCSLLVYCMRSTSFLGWYSLKAIPKQEGTEGMPQFSNVLICCSEALLVCQLKSLWDVSGFHHLFKLSKQVTCREHLSGAFQGKDSRILFWDFQSCSFPSCVCFVLNVFLFCSHW